MLCNDQFHIGENSYDRFLRILNQVGGGSDRLFVNLTSSTPIPISKVDARNREGGKLRLSLVSGQLN